MSFSLIFLNLLLALRLWSFGYASESFYLVVYEELDDSDANQTRNQTCEIDSNGASNSLGCLCGDNLINATERYQQELKDTCEQYSTLSDASSDYSICESTFQNFGYGIERVEGDPSASSDSAHGNLSNSALSEIIESIEAQLDNYKLILDRTIVGVLVDKTASKCPCLESYKKWLCVTKLPLFSYSDAFHCNQSQTGRQNITINNDTTLYRLKPCISACHSVLQKCPYYIPSRYQPTPQKLGDVVNETEVLELVYGGYPAFDCPISPDSSSDYDFSNICCLGKSAAISPTLHHGSTVISTLLLVLIIRTIT